MQKLEIHADVGNAVVRFDEALNATGVENGSNRGRKNKLKNGRRNQTVRNGAKFSVFVDSGRDLMESRWAIDVVLHVFFARPNHFYGLANGFREQRGLHGEVGPKPAPEAAANRRAKDLMFSLGSLKIAASVMRVISCPCVGPQISTVSPETRAVQFIGSMVA